MKVYLFKILLCAFQCWILLNLICFEQKKKKKKKKKEKRKKKMLNT